MKANKIAVWAGAALFTIAANAVAFAGEAMDDLQDMRNTGETFDGSDGRRSGMDIDFIEVDGPEIPEPTPVPVEESSE